MKTLKTALLCAATAAVLSSPTNAESAFKPYIGAEYQRTTINYKTVDFYAKNLDGGAAYIGARMFDRWGLELGYSTTNKKSKSKATNTAKTDTTIKVKAVTVDVLGYVPIGESEKFEWIGAIGAARIKAEEQGNFEAIGLVGYTAAWTSKETQLRVGTGVQYEFAENWNLRGMLRWQDRNNPLVQDAYTLSLGVNYTF